MVHVPSFRLRLAALVGATLLSSVDAHAQTKAEPAAPAAKPGAEATEGEAPNLPAPVDEAAEVTAEEDAPSDDVSAEDLARLKAQIKAELAAELKQQMQSELEAAARDAADQKAAAIEWEEERWVEEVRPKLNFLEFGGYFRTRVEYFNRLDLGTYDPIIGRGTSSQKPPTLYRPFDGLEGCRENNEPTAFPGQLCEADAEDTSTLLSVNMRLRLEPTLNVSEDIRIRGTVDVLDNMVFGSTPTGRPANPSLQLPVLQDSQAPMQQGVNAIYDAVRIRRLWAEIMTPFGELRAGRMPQHWGLGLWLNSGNKVTNNYGDTADQIQFASQIAGHYFVPAYSVSASGPNGRGGGSGTGGDYGVPFFPSEDGQRFNLDPRDDVHTFYFSIARKNTPEDIEEGLKTGWPVFNYGVMAAYRRQEYDLPTWYLNQDPMAVADISQYVRRNANIGIASGWFLFRWEKFRLEAEAVFEGGQIQNTAGMVSGDINAVDTSLATVDGDQPLWLLRGGAAFESSYAFLNDSFVVGVDGGFASGDQAPGWGLRPGLNGNPQAGDVDGKQYGRCLARNDAGDCTSVDNLMTNFAFDSDYQIDLLMFREVVGTVTNAGYVKPHIAYYLTENIGARADLLYAHAMFAESTPGQQAPMGLELDGKVFYGSDDGLFLMLQGGFLWPFAAFNHARDPDNADIGRNLAPEGQPEIRVTDRFLAAQWTYTVQGFVGVQF